MTRRHCLLAFAGFALVVGLAGCFPTPADRIKNHGPGATAPYYGTGRTWVTFRSAPFTAPARPVPTARR